MATKTIKWHCVPCDGAAHYIPWIDNCGQCAPRWGTVVVPESCATVEEWRQMYWRATNDGRKSLDRKRKLAATEIQKEEDRKERERWLDRLNR